MPGERTERLNDVVLRMPCVSQRQSTIDILHLFIDAMSKSIKEVFHLIARQDAGYDRSEGGTVRAFIRSRRKAYDVHWTGSKNNVDPLTPKKMVYPC